MTLETQSVPSDTKLQKVATIHMPQTERVPTLLHGKDGRIKKTDLLTSLFPDGNYSPRSAESAIQSHRKMLKPQGRTIRYTGGDDGEYQEIEIGPVMLPNGNQTTINGERQREALVALIKRGVDGISAYDFYGVNNKRKASSFDRLITKLRKQISDSGYHIDGLKNEEDTFRYTLNENEPDTVTLPDGKEIKGLTKQERDVLQYFIDQNLPIYMSTLVDIFMKNKDFVRGRGNIARIFSVVNKALGEKAKITRVTKYYSENPAYKISINNPVKRSVFPFINVSDELIRQRTERITAMLEAQSQNKSLILTDEANDQLNTELHKLQEESEFRKRAEEKRQRLTEWFDSHKEPGKIDELPYEDPENERSPLVSLTKAQYRFDMRGLPGGILDIAGQHALETAQRNYDPNSGVSFDEYAKFFIRGAMGNMLLHNSVEAPPSDEYIPIQNPESVNEFKEKIAIALIDLSNKRRYSDIVTPDESRAVDIMFGITGKNPGSAEDVAFELDCGIRWAERLFNSALTKIKNSPHAPSLAKYFA